MFTKADIERYFNAEKNESLLFIIIGLTAILLAFVFFFYLKTNWHKGFAIPLLIVGMLHFVAGYTVYMRSDEDRKRNVYAYDMNPDELRNKEIPRMEKVNKKFYRLPLYRNCIIDFWFGIVFLFSAQHRWSFLGWPGYWPGNRGRG